MIPGIPEVNIDFIGTIVAAVLTLCVFSYLLGIKFLYRLALHILIGAGVGYACLVAWWSILYPRVVLRLWGMTSVGNIDDLARVLIAGVGTLLGLLLVFKIAPRVAWVGNIATGYLVGVGLGVAVGGAVFGTLFTQVWATATLSGTQSDQLLLSALNSVILVFGTLTALIAFTFSATWRKGPAKWLAQLVEAISGVGRIFVYVALGAAFAGAYVAGVSVLVGRVLAVLPIISVAVDELSRLIAR